MADNQYVNKIEFDGQTLMDLTGDTVEPTDVLNGVTFHDRSGTPQQGSLITHNVYDGLDSSSTSDALSAKQGNILNQSIATFANMMPNKINCVRKKLTSGTAWTYTFPSNETIFFMFVTRIGVTSTNAEGLFVGGCGTTNGHVSAIGTAAANLTASMNKQTLSLTASTTNMIVTIIYADV